MRGLVETNPHFHEEYEGVDDATVIDRYMSDIKKATEDGTGKDVRLLQEMGWRHRLREEAARAVDSGDAICRGVYADSIPRMFDGSHEESRPNDFIPTIIEMIGDQMQEIGAGAYGTITLSTRQGSTRKFLARFSEGQPIIFDTTLTVSPAELNDIREASADDCCQLVRDLQSMRSLEMSNSTYPKSPVPRPTNLGW